MPGPGGAHAGCSSVAQVEPGTGWQERWWRPCGPPAAPGRGRADRGHRKALVRTGVVDDHQGVAELAEDPAAPGPRAAAPRCWRGTTGRQSGIPLPHLGGPIIDADMALKLGMAGLAGDGGLRDTEAGKGPGGGPGRRPGRSRSRLAGGAGLEVVIGPAGAGKTAMLAAAQAALPGPGAGSWWCLAPTRKAAFVASAELRAPGHLGG